MHSSHHPRPVPFYLRSSALVLLSLFIALTIGCGGGGGDKTPPPTPDTPSEESNEEVRTESYIEFLDKNTNEPITGAKVMFVSIYDELNGHAEYDFVTNDAGRVIITKAFNGNGYYICARKEGYLPATIHPLANAWIYTELAMADPMKIYMIPKEASLSATNKYKSVADALATNPSQFGTYATRKSALTDFDELVKSELPRDYFTMIMNDFDGQKERDGLLDTTADASTDMRQFYKQRYDQMVAEIKAPVTDLTIWKTYNMGIIIKEGETVLAVDLIRHHIDIVDDALWDELDAALVTHEHRDHYDGIIARTTRLSGTPHFVPERMKQAPFEGGEWFIHSSADIQHAVGMPDDHTESLGAWAIKAIATPHTVQNMAYLITSPAGVKILHTGDGSIDSTEVPNFVSDHLEVKGVDFLVSAGWIHPSAIDELITAINPKCFIPGHFNEIGHELNGRYPYSSVDAFAHQEKIQVLFFGDKTSVSEVTP